MISHQVDSCNFTTIKHTHMQVKIMQFWTLCRRKRKAFLSGNQGLSVLIGRFLSGCRDTGCGNPEISETGQIKKKKKKKTKNKNKRGEREDLGNLATPVKGAHLKTPFSIISLSRFVKLI